MVSPWGQMVSESTDGVRISEEGDWKRGGCTSVAPEMAFCEGVGGWEGEGQGDEEGGLEQGVSWVHGW